MTPIRTSTVALKREGMSPGRELLLVGLLFGLLVLLGTISPVSLGVEGLSLAEAQRAYRLAWEISDALEDWSNWIVDGDERFRPDEAEETRVFRKVEELISLLCRELSAHGGWCKYPGY